MKLYSFRESSSSNKKECHSLQGHQNKHNGYHDETLAIVISGNTPSQNNMEQSGLEVWAVQAVLSRMKDWLAKDITLIIVDPNCTAQNRHLEAFLNAQEFSEDIVRGGDIKQAFQLQGNNAGPGKSNGFSNQTANVNLAQTGKSSQQPDSDFVNALKKNLKQAFSSFFKVDLDRGFDKKFIKNNRQLFDGMVQLNKKLQTTIDTVLPVLNSGLRMFGQKIQLRGANVREFFSSAANSTFPNMSDSHAPFLSRQINSVTLEPINSYSKQFKSEKEATERATSKVLALSNGLLGSLRIFTSLEEQLHAGYQFQFFTDKSGSEFVRIVSALPVLFMMWSIIPVRTVQILMEWSLGKSQSKVLAEESTQAERSNGQKLFQSVAVVQVRLMAILLGIFSVDCAAIESGSITISAG